LFDFIDPLGDESDDDMFKSARPSVQENRSSTESAASKVNLGFLIRLFSFRFL